ncbi:hypothetical protein N9891_01360 [bacterium]|nr:hypothetical protein [bacterium]
MENLMSKLFLILTVIFCGHVTGENAPPLQIFLTGGNRLTNENGKSFLYIEPGCGRFEVERFKRKNEVVKNYYVIKKARGGWVDIDGDGQLERSSLVNKIVILKVPKKAVKRRK